MKQYPVHFKQLFSLVVLLALVYAVIQIYLEKDAVNVRYLVHFIPMVAVLLLYRFGFRYNPIDFDADFLYLQRRRSKIPLYSIQSIKLTGVSDLRHNRYWKVTYVTGKLESVTILPSTIEDSFSKFIEAVKVANPLVDSDVFEFKLHFGFLPATCWRPK